MSDDTRTAYAKAHDGVLAAAAAFNDALAAAREHADIDLIIRRAGGVQPHTYVNVSVRVREGHTDV